MPPAKGEEDRPSDHVPKLVILLRIRHLVVAPPHETRCSYIRPTLRETWTDARHSRKYTVPACRPPATAQQGLARWCRLSRALHLVRRCAGARYGRKVASVRREQGRAARIAGKVRPAPPRRLSVSTLSSCRSATARLTYRNNRRAWW